jgi:hypothetical protein
MTTRLTSNLKLRVADSLTSDAVYNLERIDLLGAVFPLGSTSDLTIQSEGNIILNPNGGNITLNGNTDIDGSLSLRASQFNFTLQTTTQTADITLTLPPDTGTTGQFLTTDGTGITTWTDPPSSNFSTLNDTNFSNLVAGQIAQYNGTTWVNITSPATRQAGTFTWTVAEGATKSITHNFNSTNVIVWMYDAVNKMQVFVDTIDYVDSNTILLTADEIPSNDYTVQLIQVS